MGDFSRWSCVPELRLEELFPVAMFTLAAAFAAQQTSIWLLAVAAAVFAIGPRLLTKSEGARRRPAEYTKCTFRGRADRLSHAPLLCRSAAFAIGLAFGRVIATGSRLSASVRPGQKGSR